MNYQQRLRRLRRNERLQKQFGNMFLHPQITENVLRNTLKTVLTIKASYDKALNYSRQLQVNPDGTPRAGPNFGNEIVQAQYDAAYGVGAPGGHAMLRDGYVAKPAQ